MASASDCVLLQGRAWPGAGGSAEEAAHQDQVFPGLAHERGGPREGQGEHQGRTIGFQFFPHFLLKINHKAT